MNQNLLINQQTFEYKIWPVENPVAMVQIAHGMAEYVDRYDDFAKFLNKNNILVFGMDHRGHGLNHFGHLGHIADKNGGNLLVEDLKAVQEKVKKEYPDLPLFLLGHSMGSFVARAFISKYPFSVDGVILSGTGHGLSSSQKIFRTLISINSLFFGSNHISNMFNKMFNKDLISNIEHPNTDLDWLSYNEDNVEKYMEDPLCGFNVSNAFFKDIVSLVETVSDEENIRRISKHLPILNIAGNEDPVGGNGESVKELQQVLEKYNEHAEIKLYENMRHEILNEKNNMEVYTDILNFIEKNLQKVD